MIAIKDANKAVKLAQVLIDNGLPCAEVTFRTEQAALAMNNMREAFPKMLIAAGTVLTTTQVDQA
ncbi:keto-deoxy-phosphogluconate aldolase, partial [Streptomyces sp. P9(2023)]|nr:keto-deoxy-phosphogluconate aldolase [Streptomyces sp. P9(2023)]